MGYFEERMEKLGITPEINKFTVSMDEHIATVHCFDKKDTGDIEISYFQLNGEFCVYDKGRKTVPYTRIRLSPENEADKGRKYESPYKSGSFYYYPAPFINQCNTVDCIDTMVVTEGEFKAFKASMHGLPTVGISGIQNIEKTADGLLSPDFAGLIRSKKTKNLVLLFDADCVSERRIEDDFKKGKDLKERLNNFYTAVKRFREMIKASDLNVDLYFARINADFERTAKGLDDLLCTAPPDAVKADLLRFEKAAKYFECINITDNSLYKLLKYFLLNLDKKSMPMTFYERMMPVIDDQEFVYGKTTFQMKDGRLVAIHHPAAEQFIRVGCGFYYKGWHNRKNAKGEMMKTPKLIEWDKGTITDDYGYINGFLNSIKKYLSFCNIPENNPDLYRAEIDGCYNLYAPLKHTPKAGSVETTMQMLNHVFGDQITLGLDWLTILHRFPTQKLPAIIFANKEQGTGKSTPLYWLHMVYGENATIIGNEDFSDQFNSHWVSKILVGIEEGLVEKKMVKERIKAMITEPTIRMRAMNKNKSEIDNNTHFIMTTNNEDNFMQLDKNERRFWVRHVPKINKELYDPLLLEKLEAEIPAYLDFIGKREIVTPKTTDLWFHYSQFINAAAMNVVENTRPAAEIAMIEYFEEIFYTADSENIILDEIQFTLQLLAQHLVKRGYKFNNADIQIKNICKKWGLEADKVASRIAFPYVEEIHKTEAGVNSEGQFTDEKYIDYTIKWVKKSAKKITITRKQLESINEF